MQRLRREITRFERGARYSVTLMLAMLRADQRHFLHEALAFCRSLPRQLDQPLPAALVQMTPVPAAQTLDSDTIRRIVDALTAFGAGRPLGICLRRSLGRYHFLRRAGLPVVVVFGARRLGDGIGGHAWLTLDGEPYHELLQSYQNYAVMFTFPADS
ncbi:MAG: lasso peptide biosynthesis B2 protein [Caldilineales bacterium]